MGTFREIQTKFRRKLGDVRVLKNVREKNIRRRAVIALKKMP
jgi:hypothetical protein